jgi:hypothetical protein
MEIDAMTWETQILRKMDGPAYENVFEEQK